MLLLGAGGLLAGAMNALAGGGSFVSLPVLIAAGVSPVAANASSTVALFPGGLASAWAYRDGMGPVAGVPRRRLLAVTLTGGLAGSILLLSTPAAAFDAALPWLLLFATLALPSGAGSAPPCAGGCASAATPRWRLSSCWASTAATSAAPSAC